MGIKKVLAMILIIISFGSIGCNENSNLSKAEKIKEFEYLYEVIEDNYPYIWVNERLNNIKWLENKEDYLSLIKETKNDEEYIDVISEMIGDLNNGHTGLFDANNFKFFKIVYSKEGLYDFWDNEEVKSRYRESDLTEEKIEQIMNGSIGGKNITLKDVVEEKIGYMHLPQMHSGESLEEDMKEIKKYLYEIKDHQALIIDIRGNTGGSDYYWMELVSNIAEKTYSRNGYMLFREGDVVKDYLNKRGIKRRDITELPTSLDNKLPKEVRENFNSFITSTLGISKSEDSINFEGEIYLLVDEFVYSSAESFAIFAKEENFATLIGERTGGDGGGIDPVLFNLENSGLVVRMSSDMFITKSGVANEEFKTEPDYVIEKPERMSNFEEDLCIQKVLELEGVSY